MIVRRFLPFLALLALPGAVEAAADLARIDRAIAKEPAYQSQEVKYCLLVFRSFASLSAPADGRGG
jgi:hypothetical protein